VNKTTMPKIRIGVTALWIALWATPAHSQGLMIFGSDNLERSYVDIPMRDGVKLFTVILKPKDQKQPLPIIMERTPYGAQSGASAAASSYRELHKDGYIFVFQDIRGRFRSQGKFVMLRPTCVTKKPQCLDEGTDSYDTVKWLIENVVANNGRVGQIGVSYPGWLVNASAFNPHPALKALSPQATMGDAWMGDDSFHQGAFRLSSELEYVGLVEASRDMSVNPVPAKKDMYDWYLSFPTLGQLTKAVGADAWPSWRRVMQHPTYDREWQSRSVPKLLKRAPVPTLTVGGFWDQEDIYGPQATYAAMETNDKANHNSIVLGPWFHGQWRGDHFSVLEELDAKTMASTRYRKMEANWFAYWLKGRGDGRFAEATVYDAGIQKWREFTTWPPLATTTKQLFFHNNGKLSFSSPTESTGFAEYVSDPANPVPYQKRPIKKLIGSGAWTRWMTSDQRFLQGRNDVLSWQTEPLTEDLTVAGNMSARLTAATTGTDADWVVKLIDVQPGETSEQADTNGLLPRMNEGYQLMVAGDIMRGRYRNSWQSPQPILSNTPTTFKVNLHQQAYTFKKGHRMMVQVHSSWFPLYDRNPQTWVPNIFQAQATDYQAQTHRIYQNAQNSSYVQLQILP
jgi:uncharacterized protein